MPGEPFVIDTSATTRIGRAVLATLGPLGSWLLQTDALSAVYRSLPDQDGEAFEEKVLRALDIGARCPVGDLSAVPKKGPLVITASLLLFVNLVLRLAVER